MILWTIVIIIVVVLFVYFNKSSVPSEKVSSEKLTTLSKEERVQQKAQKYDPGIEIVNPSGFINANGSFNLSSYVGKKVILVDFWTYSCINCQRTLPYVTAWHNKYADEGLLIVGIHTPEFDFEKKIENVQAAADKYSIKYPVVLDNDYATWRAYQNRYWPRKYLIDIDGFIVYDHIGEGGYAETEQKIQELLQERKAVLNENITIATGTVNPDAEKAGVVGTPEIYFGYGFSRNQFGNAEGWKQEATVNYTLPKTLKPNLFYLEGSWKNNNDNMESIGSGTISLVYTAKQANIVAGSDTPTKIQVFLDGKFYKELTVQEHDLYTLVDEHSSGQHILEIKAQKGLQAYTFTFG